MKQQIQLKNLILAGWQRCWLHHLRSVSQKGSCMALLSTLFPHDSLSCGDLLHLSICHVDKFLHMTDFFPPAPPVVPVTNMRYRSLTQES